MRFTTRLSALISMLVALAMLLMLLGVTFSFLYLNKQSTEQHLQALAATYDQALLTHTPAEAERWMPPAMRMLDMLSSNSMTPLFMSIMKSLIYAVPGTA